MTINDIHGWFDYADLYREAIKRCPPGGTIVELGVWCGKSLAFLAQESSNEGQKREDIKIIGIDLWNPDPAVATWPGYQFLEAQWKRSAKEICEENLKKIGVWDRVMLIQSDTIEAAKLFEDSSVDFVWFDSNHDAFHVFHEIDAWLPKLKRPTWCGGHDVQSPGLFASVKKHFPDAREVPGDFGSWRAEMP